MTELAGRARADRDSFLYWIVKPGNRSAEAFYRELEARAEPLSAMVVRGAPFEALAASSPYCDTDNS